MSIFDQFDENLPGDRSSRIIKDQFKSYEDLGDKEEIFDKPFFSLTGFNILIFLVFSILIFKLINLQIQQGAFNRVLAEGNRLRSREIMAPRGLIYDQKLKPLVRNDASFSLVIYPQELPKGTSEKQEFYNNLSQITQISPQEIETTIKQKGGNRADPINLRENIDRDSALLLEVKLVNLPGVYILKKPIRYYSGIEGLSQTLGYTGKITEKEFKESPGYRLNAEIGKEGLEKIYEQVLKGKPGISQIEVDARGRAQRLVANVSPEPGNNLVLALNGDLQVAIADTLKDQLKRTNAKAGAAVAINPNTGGILALASFPGYDNNEFAKGIGSDQYQELLNNSNKPMFNRVVSGNYPSGSTIKPMVAAAALQEGIITGNTTITDYGEIRVGNWVFPDWKTHGTVDVRKAIAESCNVFFYAIGGGWEKIKGLGVVKLKNYLEKFGLGSVLGVDLPNEAKGLVPDNKWKEKTKKEAWYLGDTYHMSIGQGDIIATPLQIASAIGVIANNGELLKPYLVEKVTDKDGNLIEQTSKKVIRSGFINPSNLKIVREGMRQTVTDGSATSTLGSLNVQAAAKTGTAQYGNEGKLHGWMVAFAPYENPQMVIVVIVEGGGEGYATAGPVIKEAFKNYFGE